VFAVLLAIPAMRKPPKYTATTTFITEGEQPAGRLILGGITLPTTAGKGPEFYVELMRSPAVLGPLVERKFEAEPGKPPMTLIERYVPGEKNPQIAVESAVGVVAGMMATKISPNGIITLRVTAEDPRLAANIAQGILEQVDDFNNNKRKSQASAERKFAEQRLIDLAAEVRATEDAMKSFLERNHDIGRSPTLLFEREHLTEQLNVKRTLYSSVVQAYERARMDEVRDSPRATVLKYPSAPTGPDRRSTTRFGVLGFFLGMMLAAFLALTREYFARIRKQASPEAAEFVALQAESTERLRRPIEAILSTVRKSQQPTNVS
jgi:uncharacterized protein involved in exopolysaccharide biosynthesis